MLGDADCAVAIEIERGPALGQNRVNRDGKPSTGRYSENLTGGSRLLVAVYRMGLEDIVSKMAKMPY